MHTRTISQHQSFDRRTLLGTAVNMVYLAALHLVNAWNHKNGICMGQLTVNDKSNEIIADPRMIGIRIFTLTGDVQENCRKDLSTSKEIKLFIQKSFEEMIFEPEQTPLKCCDRYKKQIGNETIEVIRPYCIIALREVARGIV